MPLFGSTSRTTENVSNYASDERIIADGEGVAVNSGGGRVTIDMVPDEAWELAELAIGNSNQALAEVAQSFQTALTSTQTANRSEGGQLINTALTWGLPILAIAYVFGAFKT